MPNRNANLLVLAHLTNGQREIGAYEYVGAADEVAKLFSKTDFCEYAELIWEGNVIATYVNGKQRTSWNDRVATNGY